MKNNQICVEIKQTDPLSDQDKVFCWKLGSQHESASGWFDYSG